MDEQLDDLDYDANQETETEAELEPQRPARAVPARKPGWLARLGQRVSNQVSRIGLPEWNIRNFLYGLAVLIALILIWRNWPNVRLDVLVWRFDVPKSVVIIAAMLLGAGLVRTWDAHRRRATAAEQAEQDTSGP